MLNGTTMTKGADRKELFQLGRALPDAHRLKAESSREGNGSSCDG